MKNPQNELGHYKLILRGKHGSHRDWKSGKTWKNGKAFSSQGKVREFCQDWKSQGILPKILEKQENLNKKNVFCESQGILHKMLENQWI